MIRKDLSEISKSYKRMGFDERTEKPKLKVILYSFTIVFLVVNEFFYTIHNWDNLEKRVNGLKGICMYTICITILAGTLFMWNDMKLLLKIINEKQYKFPFKQTKQRICLKQNIEQEAIELNTSWHYLFTVYSVSGVLAPVAVFLVETAQYGIRNMTAEMIYSPLPFYYPENYNALWCQFVSFLMQSFVYVVSIHSGKLSVTASIVCMKLIQGELKLLRLSLEEMDSLIVKCITSVERSGLHLNKDSRTIATKMFLMYFVRHHYDIHRKVTEATKGMKVLAFSIFYGMSLMICMTIYSLVKENVFMFKLHEFCFGFCAMYGHYCLDLMGENVSTEDNKLRQAIYHCAWIDKPLWFKKSIQLIMTRTNRMIQIQSAGMFQLSMKSFTMMLQAMYSFYSMLINVKR